MNTYHWFDQTDSIFQRAPGYITFDHETRKQVTQESRSWIAGLSDEGGAGSWLGAVMKQLVLPNKEELKQVERFVDTTLWGHIQYKSGKKAYGVRKSLFFYAPDSLPPRTYDSAINFTTWAAWPVKEAMSTARSYNYPHVAAAYWSLYRLARNYNNLVQSHPWQWYLRNAYETFMNMEKQAPYYARFGQMEGTVFYFILKDLKAEGFATEAVAMEALLKKRALYWDSLPFPFESEMPWDSTGQEEVYIWSIYFGMYDKANVTYHAILAYMPAIPHWAYNGNARRYWDFLYAGKIQRIERMIHHYGSALNAIPLLDYYQRHPQDIYTLRVAYGGVMGSIANIDKDGFAPTGFHSFPSTLKNDALSGDYGCGFFGYAVNSATYLVYDATFGWLSFGGNIKDTGKEIECYPTTASRNHIFLAPLELDIHFLSGQVDHFEYKLVNKKLVIWLKPSDRYTDHAILQSNKNILINENVPQKGDYEITLDPKFLKKIEITLQ